MNESNMFAVLNTMQFHELIARMHYINYMLGSDRHLDQYIFGIPTHKVADMIFRILQSRKQLGTTIVNQMVK